MLLEWFYEGDVSELDPTQVMADLKLEPGQLDLILGCPPCQTFSTTGKRATVQDRRGTMLWQFLRFVEAFKPKAFLLENVRGLMSAALKHRPIKDRPDKKGPPLAEDEQPGSVLRSFIRDLHDAYRMDCFEVNAVNYGSPQLRERAMLVGNRFNRLAELLDDIYANKQKPAEGSHEACRVVYVKSHIRTRQWFTRGESVW